MITITITSCRLDAWRQVWPCSTLRTGWIGFNRFTGDLEDIGGKIANAEIDGHELDAYVNRYQSAALRAVRGTR